MPQQRIQLACDALSGGPLAIDVCGRRVGVFPVGDAVYAIDDLCPHAHAPLHEGHVDGLVVECAFHNARFHLPSGKCLSGPAADVTSYPVRRRGGMIEIDCLPAAGHDGAPATSSRKEIQK